MTGTIQTVLGPVPAERMGFTLCHEHILCDFVGADKTGPHRWNPDEVAAALRPLLVQAKERGVRTFVDCTPAFIGRDPRLLKRLAEETSLNILTNTGLYGGADDKFVPDYAYRETAAQLADRWVREWEKGIDGTGGVRPGQIKIGVDAIRPADDVKAAGALSKVDAKLVSAAARASRRTGLTVTCHTGGGPAGLAAARRFKDEGGDPARFIVAHSDGHGEKFNLEVASLGAWVSFDGIGWRPAEESLKQVRPVLERHPERLLLSMDSGWWNAGEPNGGKIRDYNSLTDTFLPALRKSGVSEETVRRLTVENPARAFAAMR